MVAVSHSTSHICSTFVANLIATTYEMCRTSTQRIRTSTNVEGRLLLHYFIYLLFHQHLLTICLLSARKPERGAVNNGQTICMHPSPRPRQRVNNRSGGHVIRLLLSLQLVANPFLQRLKNARCGVAHSHVSSNIPSYSEIGTSSNSKESQSIPKKVTPWQSNPPHI